MANSKLHPYKIFRTAHYSQHFQEWEFMESVLHHHSQTGVPWPSVFCLAGVSSDTGPYLNKGRHDNIYSDINYQLENSNYLDHYTATPQIHHCKCYGSVYFKPPKY
jgi:hypothetical protein